MAISFVANGLSRALDGPLIHLSCGLDPGILARWRFSLKQMQI